MRGLSVILEDIEPRLKHCWFSVSYIPSNLPPTKEHNKKRPQQGFCCSFLPIEQNDYTRGIWKVHSMSS